MQLNDLHDIRITITSSFSDKLQLQLVRVRLRDKRVGTDVAVSVPGLSHSDGDCISQKVVLLYTMKTILQSSHNHTWVVVSFVSSHLLGLSLRCSLQSSQ